MNFQKIEWTLEKIVSNNGHVWLYELSKEVQSLVGRNVATVSGPPPEYGNTVPTENNSKSGVIELVEYMNSQAYFLVRRANGQADWCVSYNTYLV